MITAHRITNGTGRLLALAFLLGAAAYASAHWLVSVSHAQSASSTAGKKAPKSKSKGAAITRAIAMLKSGKTAKATIMLNKAISAGGMSSSNMARALHYRGLALRKQGKPAQAIADLTSALWLKNGLTGALRKEAETNRAAAYRDAGYARATGRDVAIAASKKQSSPRAAAARKRVVRSSQKASDGKNTRRIIPAGRKDTGGWQANTTANTPATSPGLGSGTDSGSPIGKFFSNLFSSGGKSQPSQPSKTARDATQISAWNSTTSVNAAKSRTVAKRQGSRQKQRSGRNNIKRRTASANAKTRKIVNRKKQPARRATKAARPSRYRLILSPVRSEAKARANAQAMTQRFASQLAQRQPVIETTSFGGSTFYQVRIGPFDGENSPRNICAQLKAGGVDCILYKL